NRLPRITNKARHWRALLSAGTLPQTLRVSSPFSTAHVQNIGRSLWTTPPARCPATLSDTRRIFHQPLFPAPDTARPRSGGLVSAATQADQTLKRKCSTSPSLTM